MSPETVFWNPGWIFKLSATGVSPVLHIQAWEVQKQARTSPRFRLKLKQALTLPPLQVTFKRLFVFLGMDIHNCIHLAVDFGAFESEIINIWAEQLKPADMGLEGQLGWESKYLTT